MSYQAIINANIVLPDRICEGSVVYENREGKICGIYERGSEAEKRALPGDQIDAERGWVVPGGIDPHVHLGGFGSIPIMDNFYTGSLGALVGGTTTVIDFCEPERNETAAHCMERRFREAQQSAADYGFHYVLTEEWRRQMEELEEIRSGGIGSFKLFTVYENTTLNIDEIELLFAEMVRRYPGVRIPFLIHAEEDEMIGVLRKRAQQFPERKKEMSLLAWTRPAGAETEMVRKIAALAEKSKVSVCIAHTSAAGTVRAAGKPGSHLWLETCPHYLEFVGGRLKGKKGALYTMTPPLREKEDQEELWRGILSGRIQIFSTDHCPYSVKDKMVADWENVPCGVDGIQTRMLYLFSEGVLKRGLSMRAYVRLTSENAARFYGMYPRKGRIWPGSDADLVLISEEGQTCITAGNRRSGIDYTIYEGKKLSGRICLTVKSGQIAYRDGNLYAEKGAGSYIRTGGMERALL